MLRQSYVKWELLIIDDAINSETGEVVENFNDSRIKYYQRPGDRKGAPACRNIGICEAKGEYLMFLDSDDLLLSTCLEERLKAFSKYNSFDFLVFPTAFFQHSIMDAHVLWNRFDERDDLLRFLSADVVWHTSGSLFKTSSIVKNELCYREEALSGQDLFFHLDVLLKKLEYKKICESPNVFIRRNPTEKRISDQHGDTDKVLNRLGIMKSMLVEDDIKRNKIFFQTWTRSILREYVNFINSGRYFQNGEMQLPEGGFDLDEQNEKIFKRLKLANKLTRIHSLINRIYNGLLNVRLSELLNNGSKYRSEMTQDELNNLKKKLRTCHY